MRIAILSHDFPGAVTSGVASYTLQCAVALAAEGHEPHIFTLSVAGHQHKEIPDGVRVHEVSDLADRVAQQNLDAGGAAALANGGVAFGYFAGAELLCEAVRRVHAEMPFDIVETPEVGAPGLPLLLRPIGDVPVVTMLHAGTAISRKFNEYVPTDDDELMIAGEFATVLLADGVCAPTRAVVEETRRHIAFDGRVGVFPSPVCLDTASARGEERRGNHTAGSFVMYAGRLETLKGCKELAVAANSFLRACPDAELRLYGSDMPLSLGGGSMRKWMTDQIGPELLPRVRFMGCVSPGEMATAYAKCRFVVAPSRFENFGTVAIEAVAAGAPVVYMAGTGLDETVADAGIRVAARDTKALADGMIRLWNDVALRQRVIESGRARRLGALSNAEAVARRIGYYKEIIAAGPRDR